MKTPEELLVDIEFDLVNTFRYDEVIKVIKEYARLCCEEQKRVCADSAEVTHVVNNMTIVDKNSILNCPNVVDHE